MARKIINASDEIKVTFIQKKYYYDGSYSHSTVGAAEYKGEEIKSISNLGKMIHESKRHNFTYVRVYNKTQDWCEDYNVSRFGTISKRTARD